MRDFVQAYGTEPFTVFDSKAGAGAAGGAVLHEGRVDGHFGLFALLTGAAEGGAGSGTGGALGFAAGEAGLDGFRDDLHDDAVGTLTLDERLGRTDFVNAAAHDFDGLRNG